MAAFGQLASILQPWLGNALMQRMEDTLQAIHVHLCGYSVRHDPGDTLDWIERKLLLGIRKGTEDSFLIQLPDDAWVRIYLSDVAAMADEVMYLIFAELPQDTWHRDFLRRFSMERPSLSALRALYTRMADLQSKEELAAIRRVIEGCYPPFRWQMWLK